MSKPKVQDEKSHNMPKISSEKEVELLVKSIEEGSKHARNVLLALLVTSLYILLSAFSEDPADKILLPLLQVRVTGSLFFAVSPVIILSLYLYLHIYVGDLRSKLTVFKNLKLDLSHIPFLGMLLFPWMVTLSFSDSGRSGDEATQWHGAEETGFAMPRLYVIATTILLIWVFSPLVLFVLWLRFVGQQQVVSLIPCLAMIAAMYGSSALGQRGRSKRSGILTISILLLGISIASVPDLRGFLPLKTTWGVAVAVSNKVRDTFLTPSSLPIVSAIVIPLAAVLLTKVLFWLLPSQSMDRMNSAIATWMLKRHNIAILDVLAYYMRIYSRWLGSPLRAAIAIGLFLLSFSVYTILVLS